MHKKIIKRVKEVIASSKYLALSCDEVTMIDNQSWISIHFYVVGDWCHIRILIYLQQVIEGRGVDNLIKVIMGDLKEHGVIYNVNIATKLISFGVNGLNVFQGVHNDVICQMQNKYSPHFEGIHCTVHCINLVVQTLSQIAIVKSIEDLLQSLYFIFLTTQKGILSFWS